MFNKRVGIRTRVRVLPGQKYFLDIQTGRISSDGVGRRSIVKKDTLYRRESSFYFFSVGGDEFVAVQLPRGSELPNAGPDVPCSCVYLSNATCHEDIIGTWSATSSRTSLSLRFVSAECPSRLGGRTCSVAIRPAGYSSIP